MLLPLDCLNNSGNKLSHRSIVLSKPSAVNQVVVAAIGISSSACCSIYCVSTMFLRMDYEKLESKAPGAKIVFEKLVADKHNTYLFHLQRITLKCKSQNKTSY